jgi:NTE family protein
MRSPRLPRPGIRLPTLAGLVATAALAPAQALAPLPPIPPGPGGPPRLALVLSGGGARGVAHVGVLRALEEAGIPVDAIAANSMGAIVGSIYASGRKAEELETIVKSMDWEAIFSGGPSRRVLPVSRRVDRYRPLAGISFDKNGARVPAGLLAEHRVNRFLIEFLSPAGYASGGDFDRLPVPFRAVATDLGSGEMVVLGRGDLARAVRASMSIPLVFPPVEWEGRQLVDGLVVNNLPVDVGRAFGPRVLVAIDIGSPALEPEDYASALGIATQVNDVLTRRRYRDFAAEADVLLRPDLGSHSSTDYSGFDELIAKGYEATKAAIPQIRQRLEAAGVEDLAIRPRRTAGPALEGAPIREVVVRGNERVSERLVLSTFNIPVGPGYSMFKGLRAFDKVDATDLLERTWMEFEEAADGGVRVVLRVRDAAAWRAEAGAGFTEWERAHGHVRLHRNNLFGFGESIDGLLAGSDAESRGEITLRGERLLLTGLGYRLRGYWVEDKPRFFDEEGGEVNRARFTHLGGDLAAGAALRRWFHVEAGLRFGRVESDTQPGLSYPGQTDQVGLAFAHVVYDTMDDIDWAEYGLRLAAAGAWSPAGLGADREYWRTSLDTRFAVPLAPRWVLQFDGLAGLSGDDLPVYEWYRVGGASLVPGYRREELKGQQTIAAGLSVRHRMFGKLRLLARAGAGNVFESASDVTLSGLRWGVGAGAMHPSPIGPVSLEVGVRDGGKTIVTLAAGWP